MITPHHVGLAPWYIPRGQRGLATGVELLWYVTKYRVLYDCTLQFRCTLWSPHL